MNWEAGMVSDWLLVVIAFLILWVFWNMLMWVLNLFHRGEN